MDALLLVKIVLFIAIFLLIVRFIFSSSREEEEVGRSRMELREEINDIRRRVKSEGGSEQDAAELMDSLMEEYYKS